MKPISVGEVGFNELMGLTNKSLFHNHPIEDLKILMTPTFHSKNIPDLPKNSILHLKKKGRDTDILVIEDDSTQLLKRIQVLTAL